MHQRQLNDAVSDLSKLCEAVGLNSIIHSGPGDDSTKVDLKFQIDYLCLAVTLSSVRREQKNFFLRKTFTSNDSDIIDKVDVRVTTIELLDSANHISTINLDTESVAKLISATYANTFARYSGSHLPNRLFEIVIPSKLELNHGLNQSNIVEWLSRIGVSNVKNFPGVFLVDSDNKENNRNSFTDNYNSSIESTFVRVFPTRCPVVVIYVPNLEEAVTRLSSLKLLMSTLSVEAIGGRASFANGSRRQMQLISPLLLPGIDIRLTECRKLSPYFNEGSQAVLEGTIASIQSDRIFGGEGHVLERKLGGTCWSEVHAMAAEKCRQTLRSLFY